MKISTGQAIKAYEAVIRLSAAPLPYAELRKLKSLRDALKAEVDFYIEHEKELVEKYADRDEKDRPRVKDGSFKISDDMRRAEYINKATELLSVEVEIAASGLKLPEEINISLADAEALEGLVLFDS